jgi:hypothetical protein
MLVRLFYVSTAVGPQTTAVTGSLLEHSRKNNLADGVTGILCQGKGLYLQVLEGPRAAVNRIYQRIGQDSRHNRVELLTYEHIKQRQYGKWSMALIDLSASDPMVLMNHTDFDPYAANDVAMTRNLVDLLASKVEIKG